MTEKTVSILKNFKYHDVPAKSISFKNRNNVTPQLLKVEYFVDLVARGTIPDRSIEANVRRYHNLSENFRELSYYVESLEEAVTIIREFCKERARISFGR